jgi:hypothetical protein
VADPVPSFVGDVTMCGDRYVTDTAWKCTTAPQTGTAWSIDPDFNDVSWQPARLQDPNSGATFVPGVDGQAYWIGNYGGGGAIYCRAVIPNPLSAFTRR